MKRDQYLTRRKGTTNWQYKRRWPKDVAESKGEQFLQRSLGTSDIEVARRSKVSLDAEFFSEVGRVRRTQEETTPQTPTEAELIVLTHQWFAEQSGDKGLFGKKPERRMEKTHHADVVAQTSEHVTALRQHLGQGHYDSVRPLARTLMKRAGFSPDLSDDVFDRFCHGLLRVQIELYAMTLAELTGDMSYSPTDDFVQQGLRFKDPSHKTLDNLIELYEKDRDGRGSPSLNRNYKALYRTLREVLGGDVTLRSIGREDMVRVRDILRDLPLNAQTRKETKGKSALEVVRIAETLGLPKRSVTRVNLELGYLSSLFNYAVRSGYVDRVFTEGLKLNDPIPKRFKGRPFGDDELKSIFSAELFTLSTGERMSGSARYWIPFILLLHGFRTNEACQLNVADVRVERGIPHFVVGYNIYADEGKVQKQVKTDASNRLIPVHPILLSMGFLHLVEKRKQEGERRLFPELVKDKDGYYSGPFSAWFSKFKKSHGINDKDAKLHAFRHNYRNALRRGHVELGLSEALGGWSSETGAAKSYGDDSAYTLEQKLEGISKVNYDCLSFGLFFQES